MERTKNYHRELESMSNFISYAQNFEDVMLWRALKHIETGFYIDVGANDPEADSVTKAFYDLGWRGLNIEPIPHWFQKLKESRLRDINLQLAVGSEPGEITLFEIPDTGLSTAERAIAGRHEMERGYNSQELKVPMDTLANLCDKYHTAPIHFLKIDVEGMEKAVLEGIDFDKVRPWIILLESMLPSSQEECYSEWEYIVLSAGYKYAYCDGINRFYLANEHPELLDAFKYPPNVFDGFLLRREQEALTQATHAESKAQEADARVVAAEALTQELMARGKELQTEIEQLHAHSQWQQSELDAAKAKAEELNYSSHHWSAVADGLNHELKLVYQSKSWRITWPLRKLMRYFRRCSWSLIVLVKGLGRLPKRAARWFLTKMINFVKRHERIKRRALRWLSRHPKLEARLRAFTYARGLMSGEMPVLHHLGETENANAALTPRGRRIYIDLQSAFEARREGKS